MSQKFIRVSAIENNSRVGERLFPRGSEKSPDMEITDITNGYGVLLKLQIDFYYREIHQKTSILESEL